MDRVLLNPWVSRAGNLSFLIGAGVLVYRLVRGQDPLWVLTIALLAIGIVLIAAPRIERWRLPAAAPPWRDGKESMGQKQVAQLTALERERQGYVHRLKSGRDRLSRSELRSRMAQVDDQIVRARDAWWEPEPRFDLLTPTLARREGGFAYLSILNRGPTIVGARINLCAPKRHERQWLARIDKSGEPASEFGSFSDIDDELVAGFPKSVRWSETNLEIHGYTNTEWKFFLPPYPGDPIHLKIGADALEGWKTWVFASTAAADSAPAFRVVRATYGVGDRKADVTDRLNSLIEEDRLDFIADNPTLVLGDDPAPNEFKTLIVRFVGADGREKSIAFNEGTHVTLPD